MDKEELVIGDWVKVPCLVDTVEGDNGCRQVRQLRDCDLDVVGFKELDYNEIIPIPLTPEILKKNGFSGEMYAFCKINDEQWLEYYYHKHMLRKWWRGIDERHNHADVTEVTFECQCHYIHQLQQAMRLCGINKTIEL